MSLGSKLSGPEGFEVDQYLSRDRREDFDLQRCEEVNEVTTDRTHM